MKSQIVLLPASTGLCHVLLIFILLVVFAHIRVNDFNKLRPLSNCVYVFLQFVIDSSALLRNIKCYYNIFTPKGDLRLQRRGLVSANTPKTP